MKKTILIAVTTVALLLLPACAKPPQETIASAETALKSAEEAQAALYAPDQLTAAREALAAAQAEVETQKEKFALTRSYKQAEALYTEAQSQAAAVTEAAIAGKAAAQTAAETAFEQARATVERSRELLAQLESCPRKVKGMNVDAELIAGQVSALQEGLPGIEQAATSEDFFGARTAAESLTAQSQLLVTDLEAALGKLGCLAEAAPAT